MAQVTSGIRSVLSVSFVYDLLQRMIGANKVRRVLCNEYLDIASGGRVLDVGCGTGQLIRHLPNNAVYMGIDLSEEYIASARKKFGDRGVFGTHSVNDIDLSTYSRIDRVVGVGLLHHLNDVEVLDMMRSAQTMIKNGGRFVTIDPCYVKNQHAISTFLVSKDRGVNVRTIEEYGVLARQVFSDVDIAHRNDLLRLPYDHAILICKS